MPSGLPSGSVTFLFTDIEGSTKLLHELGAETFAKELLAHQALLRAAFSRHGGVEVDTQGDAFFVAFSSASEAVRAAAEAQAALAPGRIRVRMGLHTGRPHVAAGKYIGADVHKAARIAAAGHGGQVLLSRATREECTLDVADLGEHRLKDFDEAVWIYQLGVERFPPLKTISNTNLPVPASTFVGRERELQELSALLRERGRLVTLTGPGGAGKTRLAIELAALLLTDFRNGVFWIELAALRDAPLVMEAVAQTLGAKEGVPAHVAEREMLLVLDNFEQVVDAAPELSRLLEVCPNLKLLVTSRERLRVRGEVEYAVPPLEATEAARLFCDRAGMVPSPPVEALCRRLDNLPLALELAAGRAGVLSPEQILERLSQRLDLLRGGRDAEARQQTLRATIDWSYELLTDAERMAIRRLGVFAGGCTLGAAEAVGGVALDELQALLDKSLIRRTGERFWMLETIRLYALERLEESGEGLELRAGHARHYAELAERAYPELRGDPQEWLDRLQAEHDNLRAALDHLEAEADTQGGLRLAGALYRFWYVRGFLREGRRRLEVLLTADPRPTSERARALHGLAVLSLNMSDLKTARSACEEAQALSEALGDPWGIAYSRYLLGMAATEVRDWEGARALFEECRARFLEIPDPHYALLCLDGLAWITDELGDSELSRTMHEQALAEARGQANRRIEALQVRQLASAARRDGRPSEALQMAREGLAINRSLGDVAGVVQDLCTLAETLEDMGDGPHAAELLGAAATRLDEIGGTFAWVLHLIDEMKRRLRSSLGEEEFRAAWIAGGRLDLDEIDALLGAGQATAGG